MAQPRVDSQFIKTGLHPKATKIKSFGEVFDTFNTNLLDAAPVNAVAASKNFTRFTVTAKNKGVLGNNITVTVVDPGVEGALAVEVTGNDIVITAARSASAITTVGTDVVTAINANPAASALVVASAGTGTAVIAVAKTKLEGGVNGTCASRAGVYFVDSTYMYIAIDQNLQSDANWRRVSLGSAY